MKEYELYLYLFFSTSTKNLLPVQKYNKKFVKLISNFFYSLMDVYMVKTKTENKDIQLDVYNKILYKILVTLI